MTAHMVTFEMPKPAVDSTLRANPKDRARAAAEEKKPVARPIVQDDDDKYADVPCTD